MNFSISLGQDSKDWIDYFSAISPFLIGVFTLGFYFWNAKNQKQQWLNDVLIKNELSVLLKMKNLLSNSSLAIEWFFTFVLADFVIDNTFSDEDILEKDEFIKQIYLYHPQILEIYNHYKENYYIFKKYGFADTLKITQFMLKMSKDLDIEKYESVEKEVEENFIIDKETGHKFSAPKFRYTFMNHVYDSLLEWMKENRPDLLNAKETCKNICKDDCKTCKIQEIALQIMERDLYYLTHKLDKLLCYSNDKEFESRNEQLSLMFLEPYTNLKNKKMTAKEKRERKAFREKLLKELDEKIKLRQDVPENDL